ncbi:hypothetical protein OH76DRAFT_1408636 [Lentinus brumalis]|uniref:Uncharacterized protein n=1 Tax=Lentinus brumalis TaxID=2498619 RepID=A0A371CX51_9APHY|nr:hypothetical protein OH76DRAFT_1408636 [Polyporus brumalis]
MSTTGPVTSGLATAFVSPSSSLPSLVCQRTIVAATGSTRTTKSSSSIAIVKRNLLKYEQMSLLTCGLLTTE